ncbi:hypothetical protein LCGC14_0807970 [marine sediment metagenome]|uniref:Uncharacterized protein n=1 Tax=marine sediment metagenome TaxID=412755 RepID=A0A0F9SV36_9ZZZZ
MFKSLTVVTTPCKICNRDFVESKIPVFNPLAYLPGHCSDCMTEVLMLALEKGHPILKYVNPKKLFD